MRTLKFRAYDSATGKVSEPFDVKESWGDYLIDFEDYSTDGALDSIIWEQFTGLLDRNGKEIYEGDIIRVFSTDEYEVSFEGIYRVYFDNRWLSYQMYKIQSSYSSIAEPFEPEMSANIEVIGNIHENPDLLERGK